MTMESTFGLLVAFLRRWFSALSHTPRVCPPKNLNLMSKIESPFQASRASLSPLAKNSKFNLESFSLRRRTNSFWSIEEYKYRRRTWALSAGKRLDNTKTNCNATGCWHSRKGTRIRALLFWGFCKACLNLIHSSGQALPRSFGPLCLTKYGMGN